MTRYKLILKEMNMEIKTASCFVIESEALLYLFQLCSYGINNIFYSRSQKR